MSNEINIELETIEVKSEEKRLRSSWKVCTSMKEWYGRLPRKKKKQLKKLMGEEGFVRWWNGLDIHTYHNVDAEKELTELLKQEKENKDE